MTTNKQKAAVNFCEHIFDIKFIGDIEDRQKVSDFLSKYLSEAKRLYSEIEADYRAYMFEKL